MQNVALFHQIGADCIFHMSIKRCLSVGEPDRVQWGMGQSIQTRNKFTLIGLTIAQTRSWPTFFSHIHIAIIQLTISDATNVALSQSNMG